jgi:riboflavin synthase
VFTGIVRELGTVASVVADGRGLRLEIEAPLTAAETAVGGSVAVNGCCLTATEISGGRLGFDAVAETLARTSIGSLGAGETVNLEPALRVGEALGGHFVQGHVDGVALVRSSEQEGEGLRLSVEVPAGLRRYIVEKGSVTLEGVSLTVAALDETGFEVALVPHTVSLTTLGAAGPGRSMNLEVDVLAKYVERLLVGG